MKNLEQINFNQSAINNLNTLMFDALIIDPNDSQYILLQKFNKTKLLRRFLWKLIEFEKLDSREEKLAFIDVIDNLNDHIEHLEILTGQRTLENIERAGKRFAKKTQFPVGIIE